MSTPETFSSFTQNNHVIAQNYGGSNNGHSSDGYDGSNGNGDKTGRGSDGSGSVKSNNCGNCCNGNHIGTGGGTIRYLWQQQQ